MKILSKNEDGTFVVSLPPKEKGQYSQTKIQVAHDYMRITGTFYPQKENNSTDLQNSFEVDTTIPIKSLIDVVLPFLNKHKYCQPEHLADRLHEKDDEYWESEWNKKDGITKPRWKKGDKYPAYSYYNQVIEYWVEGKGNMVAFCENGQKTFNHMTKQFFDKYVKDTIKY